MGLIRKRFLKIKVASYVGGGKVHSSPITGDRRKKTKMKTFTVVLEKPNGDELLFTTYANSHKEAEEIAHKEYPRHKVI